MHHGSHSIAALSLPVILPDWAELSSIHPANSKRAERAGVVDHVRNESVTEDTQFMCRQPCQQSCARLNVDGEPVAIRALKRFLVENLAFPAPPPIPEVRPEVIGILGSGPAGLMAAWELRRCGYKVIVHDTDTTPGGNLTRVIPEFRLPHKSRYGRHGMDRALGGRIPFRVPSRP